MPGGGLAMWAFLLDLKGEEYIRKLVQQEMFVSRNARQIADALAKGSLSLTVGVGYRDFDSFLDAKLPVRHLPTLKEGTYVSGGNGIVGIIKGAPHPNAAKLFFNWLLSRRDRSCMEKPRNNRRAVWMSIPEDWTAGRQGCADPRRVSAISEFYGRQMQQLLDPRRQVSGGGMK